jgi:hypothetical protein
MVKVVDIQVTNFYDRAQQNDAYPTSLLESITGADNVITSPPVLQENKEESD